MPGHRRSLRDGPASHGRSLTRAAFYIPLPMERNVARGEMTMAGFTQIAIGGTVAFALATATATAQPVTQFDVSGLPLFTPAGTVETLTVDAEDASDTIVPTYTGTIFILVDRSSCHPPLGLHF